MRQYDTYEASDFDRIEHGKEIKMEHRIYGNKSDLSDLISMPLEKVQALRAKSEGEENKAFDKVKEAAQKWEAKAAVTARCDRAIAYLQTPTAQHSANKWIDGQYDSKEISNMAYKMFYSLYESKDYTTKRILSWQLRWNLCTNSPNRNQNIRIAGQEKTFKTQADMEKYLQGRIKAYSHLFTEISPPIPDEHIRPFMVNGHLLPGYTSASEVKKDIEVKPSVRSELKSLAEKSKAVPSKNPPAPKRTEQEI